MNKILQFINLNRGEEDRQKVVENVVSNISFRGSNLWVLACAIVVASIGLNVNSTAVIIGAMLISPLMGPIVGAGFGLGMYDFSLLRKSLKNLLIATVVSLTVSTIYFYLSPFKETQTELLARTAPNIYDILIAFFGGLVGVIAITRVEKGNPIPGVAIATALMPPLCTAGYGLAIGNFKFFFGALYLYSINCVFICIATFLIVKYLKYPPVEQLDARRQRQVKYVMTFLIAVMLLPSIWFAFRLYEEKKYNQKVDQFIEKEFDARGYTVLYRKTRYLANPHTIELAFLSHKFSEDEVAQLTSRMRAYGIENSVLRIRQDTTDLKRDILNEIGAERKTLNQKDVAIANLQKQLALSGVDNSKVLPEVTILFPGITNISIAKHLFNEGTDSTKTVYVMLYKTGRDLDKAEKERLTAWLKQKFQVKDFEIYGETLPARETGRK
ncbi:MAG: TIGR00341 family protein [Flavobacterium sp. BFFFF1]|uniref:TIGR00341 family protein n=1 Tax=Flavobacterium sp. BFFFF1 TaxID=2015557 RepID=UPI000BDA4C01|nr:TIGR00341 family protein [Flavobacterium sp. BFFFF1]OYU80703.1 MAG: TIGR00341 family protein [Flavobacterium sp. BFFFF1]